MCAGAQDEPFSSGHRPEGACPNPGRLSPAGRRRSAPAEPHRMHKQQPQARAACLARKASERRPLCDNVVQALEPPWTPL